MPSSRNPEAIVADIEQTRAELSETIDAITDRINPIPAVKAAAGRRSTALVAGGVAVVVVAVFILRRRR